MPGYIFGHMYMRPGNGICSDQFLAASKGPHSDNYNVAFTDGHVKWLRLGYITQNVSQFPADTGGSTQANHPGVLTVNKRCQH